MHYTTKKEKCKEIMMKYFGPATAKQVDLMDEEECVEKCRTKVAGFLGSEKAKIFDTV